MICPKCGSKCNDNQLFCTKCGTKVNTFINKSLDNENPNGLKEPFESIMGGLSLEEDEEEINSYIKRDLGNKISSTEQINTDLIDEEENFQKIHHSSKHAYKSDNSMVKSKKTNKKPKKSSNKTKILIVVLIAIISVIIAVFTTLKVKESTMTKKFDKYYKMGIQNYDSQNYKDARTQFINASNNAFTTEQKLKAYEMVYKVDELVGGYEEEEIKYLEMLIDVDNSNIEYYKALIILYQNNDMDNKIDTLVTSAPSNLKEDLRNFDGTIPTANFEEGTYDKPIEIELSSTDNVDIYYTTDGSDPASSSTRKKYESPINLEDEGTYTIRALSIDKNGKQSKEMNIKYVLDFGSINPPVVSLDSGKYTESDKKIEVTADEGCKIYYTVDGTTPTNKSKRYKKAIKLPKGDSLYYFVAINEDGLASNVVTRAYNYSPEYKFSYDRALSTLSSNLASNKTFENKYGEFSNGDIAYFEYHSVEEIDNEYYYIIICDIEDKNGAVKSTKTYAVSADTGTCYNASVDGDSYKLNNLDES